jgi:hypothetical protein
MRTDFDKRWWLLPLGILNISAIIAVGIVVFGSTFTNPSLAEMTQHTMNEATQTSDVAATTDCVGAAATDDACYEGDPQEAVTEPIGTREDVATADCSGARTYDYLCYKQRFGDLVRTYGVADAFAALKNELPTNDFARSNCHLLTHFIGRGAVDLYGDDIATVYSQGDNFCGSGYYHGVMEAIVEKIGSDKILKGTNTLCTNLDGDRGHSFDHYNCAHGLGHGFMDIKGDDLFDSLKTCDTLDSWERDRCYGGVFMENVVANNNPGHSSKYLKADQPMYPCDLVGNRYKNECYQRQTSYALQTQGNDFSKVFDLCAKVEGYFRQACYQGLGWDALVQSLKQDNSDEAINGATRTLCSLGKDYEARFNCVVGAVDYFIRNYYSNTQAKAFCGYLSADLRTPCLQETEEYYTSLESPLERLGTYP